MMFAVAVGMAISFGLLGYTLTSIGLAFGGMTGKWVGLSTAFVLLCLISYFATRKLVHRSIETVAIIYVLMGAAKLGEEFGKDIGTPFAKKWLSWITFAIAFAVIYLAGKFWKKKS